LNVRTRPDENSGCVWYLETMRCKVGRRRNIREKKEEN
jgi:hypothetical protein